MLSVPICLALSGSSALGQEEKPDIAKQAEALGALAHLPKSTEAAVSIRNLSGIFDEVTKSNFFRRILELTGAAGDDANSAIGQIRQGLSTYAGEEVVISYAEGTGAEVKHLMALYDIYVRMTYGALGRGIATGDFQNSGGFDPEQMMAELKKSLADADSPMSKAIAEVQMPPMIIGSKMPGAAAGLLAQIDEFEGQLPPFVTVSNFDVEGSKFKSWAINLKDVFDENAQGQLEEMIGDKASSDRLAAAIRGKRIEVSFGALGDHLVVGIGRDHAHLKFVDDPAESLVSLPQFQHLAPYLDKPIHGIAFAKKELLEADDSNQLVEAMTESFVDGLGEGDSKRMQKLGARIKTMSDQMMLLNKRTASDYVGIMYGGNGLNGEGFGGWMLDSIKGKSKLTFANAGIENTFLMLENATKPKYNEIGMEMMETLASTVPLGVRIYGDMSGDQNSVDKFVEMKKLFAPKIEKIWGIAKEKFFAALGDDSAMIVDLNGSLPKIPGVPRVIVNEGKAPRIVMANTVRDRAKLTQAWEELVPAMNDLLASIPGQDKGAEVQMPDALSSEKDGLTTHYFGMPFMSNDFMPSLSLSDKLFFLSTSKKFSEAIASKAGKGSGDLRGIYYRVDFDQLTDFAGSWLKLVLENKDTIFEGNEFAAEDFEEGAEIAKQVLQLSRVLQSFDYNKYTSDADETRSSWHLKLDDVE